MKVVLLRKETRELDRQERRAIGEVLKQVKLTGNRERIFCIPEAEGVDSRFTGLPWLSARAERRIRRVTRLSLVRQPAAPTLIHGMRSAISDPASGHRAVLDFSIQSLGAYRAELRVRALSLTHSCSCATLLADAAVGPVYLCSEWGRSFENCSVVSVVSHVARMRFVYQITSSSGRQHQIHNGSGQSSS